jgi:hypothetical protein
VFGSAFWVIIDTYAQQHDSRLTGMEATSVGIILLRTDGELHSPSMLVESG